MLWPTRLAMHMRQAYKPLPPWTRARRARPDPVGVPARGLRRRRPRRDRRRPRARHPAGGLPARSVPDGRRPARARGSQDRRDAWWSPEQRGVLPLAGLRVTRSLRQSRAPVRDPHRPRLRGGRRGLRRPGPVRRLDRPADIAAAYTELHRLGWAHSVEAWHDGELAGGLYGVAIGGLFAGESMFTRVRDASKVALMALVDLLDDEYADLRLLDTQWQTPHLATLGVVEIPREGLPGRPRRGAGAAAARSLR